MIEWKTGWTFKGFPIIRQYSKGQISIGERFFAVSKSKYNTIGVSQPVILTVTSKTSTIIIGDDVGMSGCSITALKSVMIGNRVLIGSGALITDNDAHPVQTIQRRYSKANIGSSPVVIEDDVFIGARAIILKGVHIGRGAVVGAGAVVSKDIPALTIVAGNPATIVGKICDDKQ